VSLLLLFFIWSFFSRNLRTIVQCPLLRAAVYFTLKWLNIILCLSVVLFSDLHTVHNFKWLVDKSLYTFFFLHTVQKFGGSKIYFFINFIQQGHITVIKRDSEDITMIHYSNKHQRILKMHQFPQNKQKQSSTM